MLCSDLDYIYKVIPLLLQGSCKRHDARSGLPNCQSQKKFFGKVEFLETKQAFSCLFSSINNFFQDGYLLAPVTWEFLSHL